MGDPLEQIKFFVDIKNSPARSFTQLCTHVEANIHSYIIEHAAAYDKLRKNGPPNTPHFDIVSQTAQDERLLTAFCTSRLVELYNKHAHHMAESREMLLKEITREDINDWEGLDLLDSIHEYHLPTSPDKEDDMARYESAQEQNPQNSPSLLPSRGERFWLAMHHIFEAASMPWENSLVKWLLSIFLWAMGIVMMVCFCFFCFGWGIHGAWLTLLGAIREIPFVGSPIAWSLRNAAQPDQTEALVAIFKYIGTKVEAFVSSTAAFSAIFTSKITKDLATEPFDNAIRKTVNITLGMSEIALNFSIVPILLQHANKGVHSASILVKGLNFPSHKILAQEYDNFQVEMRSLILKSREYNSGVPSLITNFRYDIILAMQRIEKAQEPHMSFTALQIIPVACETGVFVFKKNSLLLHGICAFLTSAIFPVALCTHPENLANMAYCKTVAEFTGLKFELQRLMMYRKRAVDMIGFMLNDLSNGFRALSRAAEAGEQHCKNLATRVGKIESLTEEALQGVSVELAAMEEKSKGKRWWSSLISSEKYEDMKMRIMLERQAGGLNRIMAIQTVAADAFGHARTLMERWRVDIKGCEGQMDTLRARADVEWTEAWKYRIDWEDLQKSFERLKPVLDELESAYNRQKVKEQLDEQWIEDRSNQCYKMTQEMAARGERTDLTACLFDGLKITKSE